MTHILNRDERRALLADSRVVAVLGAHPNPIKPAFYVPDYLHQMGYRIIPVNATRVGETLFGTEVRANLGDIREPIDFVDIFRPSESLGGHLDDILAMQPLPRAVWLQLGIDDAAFVDRLVAAGIEVVRDACALADHRAFGLPPIGPRG
jgi:predicted CoA-binding protein